MPLYEYKHPKTGEIFEDIRTFANGDKPFVADDGVKCPRIMSTSFSLIIGEAKPDRYERKEMDHGKKVKDPERARRMRKNKFGTEGISITKSPHYHKQKRVKAQGTTNDIDKKDFIKSAARNPNAIAAAENVLKKRQ